MLCTHLYDPLYFLVNKIKTCQFFIVLKWVGSSNDSIGTGWQWNSFLPKKPIN